MAILTPTDCPKWVDNRCVIEVSLTVLCCLLRFFLMVYEV